MVETCVRPKSGKSSAELSKERDSETVHVRLSSLGHFLALPMEGEGAQTYKETKVSLGPDSFLSPDHVLGMDR